MVKEELRPGVIFIGRISKQRSSFGKRPVHLFVEGQKKPIGTIRTHWWESSKAECLMDQAFTRWVEEGLFRKTITDPVLLSMLECSQCERLGGVSGWRRTFRFLPAEGSTNQSPRFILTTDKSDLPDREKRILEVGEDVVLQEETEREETRKLRAKEKQNRRVRQEPLVREIVKMAINEKLVPVDSIKIIWELGLLEPSTNFRSGTQFPGETLILQYDFVEETRYSGYIGFDHSLRLISVDERLPENNQVYLR